MVIHELRMLGRGSRRLVLADSHLLVLESLATALTRRGFDVVALATTPQEVFAGIAERQPDVCLLSTRFPSCSGLVVLQVICERHPGVGVVMLSADAEPGLTRAAFRCGAAAVLPMNYHMRDLDRTLARVGRPEQAIYDTLPGTAARGPRLAGAGDGYPRRVHLTSREKEVLTHMVHGECTQQIACSLGITKATIRTHVQNVLSKLGVHSRLEATIVAAQTGMIGEYYHGVPIRRDTGGR